MGTVICSKISQGHSAALTSVMELSLSPRFGEARGHVAETRMSLDAELVFHQYAHWVGLPDHSRRRFLV